MGAAGSQASISIRKEVTWGELDPGIFQGVNFTSENMAFGLESKVSDNIRPDRQTANIVRVGASCGGGFNTEFQYGNLDLLLPGFLWSADWSADMISNGIIKSSYSIQRTNNDISQFFLYKGMVPNTIEFQIAEKSPVLVNMEFIGKDETLAQVEWGTAAPDDAPTNEILNTVGSIASIKVDGTDVPECLISDLSFKIDNQVEGKSGLGVLGFCNANAKSLLLTGSITMYFNDATYYEKYLNDTVFSLSITLTDSTGNGYKIDLLACKFDSATTPVTGRDADVLMNGTFLGIMDSTTGKTIEIERITV